jgi:hypothetical protein
VIADDHIMDFALSAQEDGKLPVDFTGQFAQASRQFMGQDPVRRDFSPVELFDSPCLSGPEAGEVAINTMDVSNLRLCGTKCRGIGFRVQGLGSRVCPGLHGPSCSSGRFFFLPPVPGPLYPLP